MAGIRFKVSLFRQGEPDEISAEATFAMKPVKPTSKFISDHLLRLLRSIHKEREGDKISFSKIDDKIAV